MVQLFDNMFKTDAIIVFLSSLAAATAFSLGPPACSLKRSSTLGQHVPLLNTRANIKFRYIGKDGSSFRLNAKFKEAEKDASILGIRVTTKQEGINAKSSSHHDNLVTLPRAKNGAHQAKNGFAGREIVEEPLQTVNTTQFVNEFVEKLYSEVDELANFSQSITATVEEKIVDLAKQSELSSEEVNAAIGDIMQLMQEDIPKAVEKRLAEALEEIAYSDTLLLEPLAEKKSGELDVVERARAERLANSSLDEIRVLRTREIVRFWRVAPLYYTIALGWRFLHKLPGPKSIVLALSSPFRKRPSRLFRKVDADAAFEAYISSGLEMQQGWKKTGEMAAKGSFRKNFEVLRRSVEIWGYFVNFYLREKRYTSRFKAGKWSQEKYSEARTRLGKEVTQNLLKLGPCFIKVCTFCSRPRFFCVF
jgi:hypothetical protein